MDKLLVLEALTKIGVQGPRSVHVGICHNLENMLEDDHGYHIRARFELSSYFRRWPESSGDSMYPVESNPAHYGMPGMWSLETENGRKRYRLLAFLIHEITKEIRNECAG